jgi:tetratricopeptide (TPR) repeat protein
MKRIARWITPATLAMLAGCAQMPAERAPRAVAPPPPVASSKAVTEEAIARHRKLAQAAKAEGDLAGAATQWQILTLLVPGDNAYRRELEATRHSIATEVAAQLQAGTSAMNAGDTGRASQAMLRVLALDPDQPAAVEALREIDRRRIAKIQSNRAAKVRAADPAADGARMRAPAAASDAGEGFDVEQAIEMFRAGDEAGGIRDLRAYVDANPGNRAARQRIGTAVAERARELEGQGAREQALALYEQASSLRGDGKGAWVARMAPLKRSLSKEYFDRGSRLYRTDIARAIAYLEVSVRYDPGNAQAAIKLQEAKSAREKFDKIK